jgi:hypothetical protein
VIPRDYITEWRARAPWTDNAQVEQDLAICRALVNIFSHPVLSDALAFRGGTALYKLYLTPAARYSEDIDFVQVPAVARRRPELGRAPSRRARRGADVPASLVEAQDSRPSGPLELGKDGWRNDHSLEQPREYRIDTAQDEIVQRRGIRYDDAHVRVRIFSSVAASASRSEAK